jgi:curved DNA-binding protein CbpA
VDVTRAYAILGLGPGASAADARSAYRGAVRRLHPDTGNGDVSALARVANAYRTIETALPARPRVAVASDVPVRHVDVYA